MAAALVIWYPDSVNTADSGGGVPRVMRVVSVEPVFGQPLNKNAARTSAPAAVVRFLFELDVEVEHELIGVRASADRVELILTFVV